MIDVETTGLRSSDRIVEVAVLGLGVDGDIDAHFESVLNPGRHHGATRIHGLTAEWCHKAPSFPQLAHELHRRLVGTILIAHNFRFDWSFLRQEMRRCGVQFLRQPSGLCTPEASRRLGIPASLGAACQAVGVEGPDSHSAHADAEAAHRLWNVLWRRGAFPVAGQRLEAGYGAHRLSSSVSALTRSDLRDVARRSG